MLIRSKPGPLTKIRNGLFAACCAWVVVVILMAMAVAVPGCASTSVKYGPFTLESTKKITVKNVLWEKTADSEKFSADEIIGDPEGTNAGTVFLIDSVTGKVAPLVGGK